MTARLEPVAWVLPKELAELADPNHPRKELHIWGHQPWTGFVPLYAAAPAPDGMREAIRAVEKAIYEMDNTNEYGSFIPKVMIGAIASVAVRALADYRPSHEGMREAIEIAFVSGAATGILSTVSDETTGVLSARIGEEARQYAEAIIAKGEGRE